MTPSSEAQSVEARLQIQEHGSVRTSLGELIISVPHIPYPSIRLVVGRVGTKNVESSLSAGGAILYSLPSGEVFEVRLMTVKPSSVEVLVSRVTTSNGFAAGLITDNVDNRPFTQTELLRIAASIDTVKDEVRQLSDLAPEQRDYVVSRLDELIESSERLGRKDWMNAVIGALAGTIVSAGLGSEFGKVLFSMAGDALSWLFGSTLRLLN